MARKRVIIERQQCGVVTLNTVLLLFTGSLLVLLLVVGFVTSYSYFRDYVSEQLSGQARDGATAVGLSLSNAIDARDPVAAASLIDSVFDSGRYLSVKYLNNKGVEVAGRAGELGDIHAPAWFRSLVDLAPPPAEAEVVRGWSRLGTAKVISHPGRAYKDLWQITIGLFVSAVMIGGVGLFALFVLLRRTLRPLRALEQQARALGRRDFRKRVTIQSTRELNQVTAAMNQMADDLGQLFEGQAKLIQHLRRVNNEDPVTGLASRNAFDQRLKAELESQEKTVPGALMLFSLQTSPALIRPMAVPRQTAYCCELPGASTVFWLPMLIRLRPAVPGLNSQFSCRGYCMLMPVCGAGSWFWNLMAFTRLTPRP
jgi:HAMP domain-containing protein